MIEDIVDVQALDSMRRFYTDDAGYALASSLTTTCLHWLSRFGDGDGSDWDSLKRLLRQRFFRYCYLRCRHCCYTDDFSDLAFRQLIKLMDDQDTPMDGRFLVIPPSARRDILGIDRYNSSDFVDGRGVNNGQIGTLYGVDIYVSSNVPVIETAADNTAGDDVRGAILGSP
jgi:hypothetical protein